MLQERGVRPERVPPSEDVKKVKRRLESEEKQIVGKTKKKAVINANHTNLRETH